MSAPVKRKCPECSKLKLKRLIGTGSGVLFKGSGFYETDYRSKSYEKDKAADKRRNIVDKGSGLEAWRTFCNEYEPQVQNRYGGLLSQVPNTKFKGVNVEEFDRWETLIREYETQSKETVPQSIKVGVLTSNISNKAVQDHTQLNSNRLTAYEDMKTMIEEYTQAKRPWMGQGGMDLGNIDGGKKGK